MNCNWLSFLSKVFHLTPLVSMINRSIWTANRVDELALKAHKTHSYVAIDLYNAAYIFVMSLVSNNNNDC